MIVEYCKNPAADIYGDSPENILVDGEKYTIVSACVYGWHTKVVLKEWPNMRFNSAHFGFLSPEELLANGVSVLKEY